MKGTVKTKDFIKVLKYWGLEERRTKGSHQSWAKKGMTRPVIVPITKKEIKIGPFKQNLKTLEKTEKEFFDALEKI